MNSYLVGSGHFAIGFCIGFLVMLYLLKKHDYNLKIQMYAPFIPFISGLWSALPYPFLADPFQTSAWMNIFLLFDYVHTNEILVKVFGRLNFITLACGAIYSYIVLHYIKLVKYCRRYGWDKSSNAQKTMGGNNA